MARRNLINVKSGVILPWNEHLAKHPDMEDYVPEAAPATSRKTLSVSKKRKRAPKQPPSPAAGTASIDDLLSGLD